MNQKAPLACHRIRSADEQRPHSSERTTKNNALSTERTLPSRGVLKELVEGRMRLPGATSENPFLRDLLEKADYLYETVNNVREGVLSLIELHLNMVSFEMNQVMRVLAV